MKFIELFAGCGGLSLGLKAAGFDLAMANELSPMAAESYAYNFFNEDLTKTKKPKRTFWLSSKFPYKDIKNRLRENPKEYPNLGEGYSDISAENSLINGGLVVGSIVDLNKFIESNKYFSNIIQNSSEDESIESIDLISGGPPCQSFSMAGLRQLDSDKNTLPWEFAKFAQHFKPKIVLLENVTGILRPFKDKDGNNFYAWFEVAKAFSKIGYIPLCLHVNAKYVGVPQNRPRFILIGIRKDIFDKILPKLNSFEIEIFNKPSSFYDKNLTSNELKKEDLGVLEITNSSDFILFKNSFLHHLATHEKNFVSVGDAIDDLRKNGEKCSNYSSELNEKFSKILKKKNISNHEFRKNNDLVRRRFRIYQILEKVSKETKKNTLDILSGKQDYLHDNSWKELSCYYFLNPLDAFEKIENKSELLFFLKKHATKKQTQKSLIESQPAPAALSIPDDACHYHEEELRTLTVREMARIQSFPDSFEFRSKVTTGGKMRSFEVPQYTQVGNAVPPLLGKALGECIKEILQKQY